MTDHEYYEEQYVLDDQQYLKYCTDQAEAYEIERALSYNSDTWLFENPKNYGLEDDYTEDSVP